MAIFGLGGRWAAQAQQRDLDACLPQLAHRHLAGGRKLHVARPGAPGCGFPGTSAVAAALVVSAAAAAAPAPTAMNPLRPERRLRSSMFGPCAWRRRQARSWRRLGHAAGQFQMPKELRRETAVTAL